MATAFKRKADKKIKGSKWIIRWWDAQSAKWRQEVAYSDREVSLEHGRKLENRSARIANGMDPGNDATPPKGISLLVDEFMGGYRAKLRDAKRNERYVMQVRSRIVRVIGGVGASLISQLDPIGVRDFLDGLKKTNGKLISGITRNEYVNCIKSFTEWAVKAGRAERDPLAALERTERNDITFKHRRKALTVEQVAQLLDRGRKDRLNPVPPPAEPDGRISRIRLSSWWFTCVRIAAQRHGRPSARSTQALQSIRWASADGLSRDRVPFVRHAAAECFADACVSSHPGPQKFSRGHA